MYWNGFEGGHGSAAVTAPSTTWLFAEGVCGGDASFNFQTYLLLANPGTTDATATITFFRDVGGPVTEERDRCRPGGRETLFLNDLRFDPGNVAALANASFSIRVSSDQPVLAERAVYWSSNGITFIEGHNSPGVTAEATKWAFAEGIEGVVQQGGPAHDSYFLISNANATAARGAGDVRARGRPRRRRHPDHPGAVARHHPHQRHPGAEPQAVRRLHRIDQRAVAAAVRRRARHLLGRRLLRRARRDRRAVDRRRSRRRRRST